jgi:asparaginyl-tRNA synthetase
VTESKYLNKNQQNNFRAVTYTKYSIKQLMSGATLDQKARVQGWVRNKRESKNVVFISLNDGSTIKNLQVVGDPASLGEHVLRTINTGASVTASGTLQASQGKGQTIELVAEKVVVDGEADPEVYPLQPKKHSMEFLREIAHLRPRSQTFGGTRMPPK